MKDGWDDGDLELIAIMEKRRDGWFWADMSMTSRSGKPSVCVDCHKSGADGVRAFSLPR